jgi:hypothetical protein
VNVSVYFSQYMSSNFKVCKNPHDLLFLKLFNTSKLTMMDSIDSKINQIHHSTFNFDSISKFFLKYFEAFFYLPVPKISIAYISIFH